MSATLEVSADLVAAVIAELHARGLSMDAPLTAEALRQRWHLETHRTLLRVCERVGLKPMRMGPFAWQALYRPADVLKAEEKLAKGGAR